MLLKFKLLIMGKKKSGKWQSVFFMFVHFELSVVVLLDTTI